MAKARTRRIVRYVRRGPRRAAKMSIPVAVLAGFVPMATDVWHGYTTGGLKNAGISAVAMTTGYDAANKKWSLELLMRGMGPVVAGIIAHKLANRLGVNRALAKAGVPLLRI